MTTHQSTSLHVEDANGDNVAFSTVDGEARSYANHTEKPVLRVWRTAFLPDGQPTELEVLFTDADVRDLRAFLADTFGMAARVRQQVEDAAVSGLSDGRATVPGVATLSYPTLPFQPIGCSLCARTDIHHHMQDPSGVHWVHDGTEANCPLPDNHYPVRASGGEGDNQAEPPRQCPHISNGVQCSYEEHSPDTGHSYETFPSIQDWASRPPTQNDAGAVPPPADAQGATNTLQPAGTGQSAAVSATSAAPASQPSAPEKKRKRRTKLEIAFDTAWEAHEKDASAETAQAYNDARQALTAKDPGNSRLNEIADPVAGQDYMSDSSPVPHFAPEPDRQPFPMPHPPFANGGPIIPNNGYDPSLYAAEEQFEQAAQPTPFNPEQAAAQAFPCPVTADDGRPCQRPYGHEIQTDLNPDPKPHAFAANMDRLREQGIQNGVQPVQQHPGEGGATGGVSYETATQVGPVFPQGFAPEISFPVQASAQPPVVMPGTSVLSFQVPPTPAAEPVIPAGADLQPPAPAAPFWQQPQGGQ